MMNCDQLRALVRQGHLVGSHTLTHPNIAQVSLHDARREMTESKERLERQLGAAVTHFFVSLPRVVAALDEANGRRKPQCGL